MCSARLQQFVTCSISFASSFLVASLLRADEFEYAVDPTYILGQDSSHLRS